MNAKLNLLVAASLMLAGGAAIAESQYGQDSTAASQVAARADLNVVVNVPKLILLRVGGNNTTVSTATVQGAFNTIPGAGGATAPLPDGTYSTGWDGTGPTLADAASTAVTVRAWTNSSGGGSVAAAVATAFTETGLDAKVTVSNSNPAAGGGLAHPGADLTGTGTATTFARNTIVGSDWTFNVLGTDLATLPAGSFTQTMRYTATTL